jgi:hypothetical protein
VVVALTLPARPHGFPTPQNVIPHDYISSLLEPPRV